MKMTTVEEQQELISFVKEASNWFESHPEGKTYTAGQISPECLFAIRWGMGDDCVLVVRLGQEFPIIYQNCIPQPTQVPQVPQPMGFKKLEIPSDTFDDDIPF